MAQLVMAGEARSLRVMIAAYIVHTFNTIQEEAKYLQMFGGGKGMGRWKPAGALLHVG